jgi:hypothetical protein
MARWRSGKPRYGQTSTRQEESGQHRRRPPPSSGGAAPRCLTRPYGTNPGTKVLSPGLGAACRSGGGWWRIRGGSARNPSAGGMAARRAAHEASGQRKPGERAAGGGRLTRGKAAGFGAVACHSGAANADFGSGAQLHTQPVTTARCGPWRSARMARARSPAAATTGRCERGTWCRAWNSPPSYRTAGSLPSRLLRAERVYSWHVYRSSPPPETVRKPVTRQPDTAPKPVSRQQPHAACR